MLKKINEYRFELILASQLVILFGSLFVPRVIADFTSTIAFFMNFVVGSFFLVQNHKHQFLATIIFIVIGGLLVLSPLVWIESQPFMYAKFIVLFTFNVLLSIFIIKQIWQAEVVDRKVIFGMMAGYISLGFIGFCIFLSLEIMSPGSFNGLLVEANQVNGITERLMYYSYITLMTIGYGEITPSTVGTQQASILIGLLGQFYLVIITAIIVGKFVNQYSNATE